MMTQKSITELQLEDFHDYEVWTWVNEFGHESEVKPVVPGMKQWNYEECDSFFSKCRVIFADGTTREGVVGICPRYIEAYVLTVSTSDGLVTIPLQRELREERCLDEVCRRERKKRDDFSPFRILVDLPTLALKIEQRVTYP